MTTDSPTPCHIEKDGTICTLHAGHEGKCRKVKVPLRKYRCLPDNATVECLMVGRDGQTCGGHIVPFVFGDEALGEKQRAVLWCPRCCRVAERRKA